MFSLLGIFRTNITLFMRVKHESSKHHKMITCTSLQDLYKYKPSEYNQTGPSNFSITESLPGFLFRCGIWETFFKPWGNLRTKYGPSF